MHILFDRLASLQNLKQQRSRREQFSQPPVSTSPLMANNFSKSHQPLGSINLVIIVAL